MSKRKIHLVTYQPKKKPERDVLESALSLSINRQVPLLLEFRDAGRKGIKEENVHFMWQGTFGSLVHRKYLEKSENGNYVISELGMRVAEVMNSRDHVYKQTRSQQLSHWIRISKARTKVRTAV